MLSSVDILNLAASHANKHSTCLKVGVGAAYIINNSDSKSDIVYSSNRGDINCKNIGECHKYKITGIYESCEETRKYCAAKHAEINLLETLKVMNIDPSGATIYVTRYPCINCARSLVDAKISKVVYGGRQEISDDVKRLFNDNHIDVEWHPECDYEDL